MKKTILIPVFAACVLMFASCQEAAKDETPAVAAATEAPKPDPAQIKTEIQAVENAWADALNKKDVNALMALYADDAVTLPDGEAPISGKAAIQVKETADFINPAGYSSIAFETQDVYAQGDYTTEVGKTMYKDDAGKVIGTGKYMAVFVKKDGKWLCLREIYNKDSK